MDHRLSTSRSRIVYIFASVYILGAVYSLASAIFFTVMISTLVARELIPWSNTNGTKNDRAAVESIYKYMGVSVALTWVSFLRSICKAIITISGKDNEEVTFPEQEKKKIPGQAVVSFVIGLATLAFLGYGGYVAYLLWAFWKLFEENGNTYLAGRSQLFTIWHMVNLACAGIAMLCVAAVPLLYRAAVPLLICGAICWTPLKECWTRRTHRNRPSLPMAVERLS